MSRKITLTESELIKLVQKIISEQSHVDYIIRYLKNNREIKTTVELKMCKK